MSLSDIFNGWSPGQQLGNSYAQQQSPLSKLGDISLHASLAALSQQHQSWYQVYNQAYAAELSRQTAPVQQDCEGCGAPLRPRLHACEYCRRTTTAGHAANALAAGMRNAYPGGRSIYENGQSGFTDPRKIYGESS